MCLHKFCSAESFACICLLAIAGVRGPSSLSGRWHKMYLVHWKPHLHESDCPLCGHRGFLGQIPLLLLSDILSLVQTVWAKKKKYIFCQINLPQLRTLPTTPNLKLFHHHSCYIFSVLLAAVLLTECLEISCPYALPTWPCCEGMHFAIHTAYNAALPTP